MRHLWSLLAGVLVAPLAWLLLATGQHRSQQTILGWDRAGAFDTGQLIGPVLFLLVAGLLLGVLATLRWSPAGPVAAGVLLVLPTGFALVDPVSTLDFFSYEQPRRLLGQDLQPWLPVTNGTLLVLGALLLVAVVSVQRWRSWPVLPQPIPPATDAEVVAGITSLSATDTGRSPMSDDEILAAAAAMGDEATGTDPPTPSSKAPVGKATEPAPGEAPEGEAAPRDT